MNDRNQKTKLYQKIANVMGKVERVPKNGYNSFHKYHYVTESDLLESVRTFMSEEGLIVFNNVKHYEVHGELATVTIEFTLACTETGESLQSIMIGQGQDKGDKAFYKAYSGATKYFLMKTFLISSGDDPEADIATDERHAKNKQQNGKQPMASEKQRNLINKLLKDVSVAKQISIDEAYTLLKEYFKKEIESYTMEDARNAITILNKSLEKGV
jgi:ERF superfamily